LTQNSPALKLPGWFSGLHTDYCLPIKFQWPASGHDPNAWLTEAISWITKTGNTCLFYKVDQWFL